MNRYLIELLQKKLEQWLPEQKLPLVLKLQLELATMVLYGGQKGVSNRSRILFRALVAARQVIRSCTSCCHSDGPAKRPKVI